MEVLTFNVLLYFFSLVYCLKKDSFVSIRVFLSLLYFLFSVFGVMTVNNGIYFDVFGGYSLSKLSFIPYLINYLMFVSLLSIIPKDINTHIMAFRCTINRISLSLLNSFVNICLCLCIFLLFLALYGFLSRGTSFGDVYLLIRSGDEGFIRNELLNSLFWKIKYIIQFLLPIICMLIISKVKKQKKVMLLLLSFISMFVTGIVIASRGFLFFTFWEFAFFLIIFWNSMLAKYKRIVFIVLLSISVVLGLFVVVISESRFSEEAEESVIRYFGETFPNLGFQIWDINGNHLMGERKFPSFYEFISGNPSFSGSPGELSSYFTYKSKYPVNNFKTLFGDVYIEFGLELSIVIISLVSIVFKHLISKTLKEGISIILIFLAYDLLLWGIFACKFDESQFKMYCFYFLFFLFTKKFLRKKNNNGCISNHSQLQHLQPFTRLS